MDCDELFDEALAASRAVDAHWDAMPMQDARRWISVEWHDEWRRLEAARADAIVAFMECMGSPRPAT
jgi:hypothetical protein